MATPDLAPIGYCDQFTQRFGTAPAVTRDKSLGSIVDKAPDSAQIIYFGEAHKYNLQDYEIELSRFTEALPALKARHITDVVMEYLPDDPGAEKEIQTFYATGRLDQQTAPTVFSLVNQFMLCALKNFLTKARELGITVHPAGVTLAEGKVTTLRSDYLKDDKIQSTAALMTKDHIQRRIEQLRMTGRKFAIFGGMFRNDIQCTPQPASNLGGYLKREFGKGYVEIDLLVPETLANQPAPFQTYAAPKNWQRFIPRQGVTAIKRENSYLVIFPLTKGVVFLDSSDEFLLKCVPAPSAAE